MVSFISTFITVGICLAIYAYIKKKYSKEIQDLQDQISFLSENSLKQKAEIIDLTNKTRHSEIETRSYKERLHTMMDINKELQSKSSDNDTIKITVNGENGEVKIVDTDAKTTAKKRGRKPGYKKPYYRKKTGGNPS
jgi:predicted RNase H-like nuclease (RuvC/YqgF family)